MPSIVPCAPSTAVFSFAPEYLIAELLLAFLVVPKHVKVEIAKTKHEKAYKVRIHQYGIIRLFCKH